MQAIVILVKQQNPLTNCTGPNIQYGSLYCWTARDATCLLNSHNLKTLEKQKQRAKNAQMPDRLMVTIFKKTKSQPHCCQQNMRSNIAHKFAPPTKLTEYKHKSNVTPKQQTKK